MTDPEIKLKKDEIPRSVARFQVFDETILPFEIENIKESYDSLIEKLTTKFHLSLKYHHLLNKYQALLDSENEELERIEKEIEELELGYERERHIGIQATKYILSLGKNSIASFLTLEEAPKEIILVFQALKVLGIGDLWKYETIDWNVIKASFTDIAELAATLENVFTNRISDISPSEVKEIEDILRHYRREFSLNQEKSHPISQALAKYLLSVLACIDFTHSIQSRKDILEAKNLKVVPSRKEVEMYADACNKFDKDLEKNIERFNEKKELYGEFKNMQQFADEAITRYKEHWGEYAIEKAKLKPNSDRIQELLRNLQNDVIQMETLRKNIMKQFPDENTQMA